MKNLQKGVFIALEGLDGSGKSTTVDDVKPRLKRLNLPITYTYEPGGTDISDQIRNILLSPYNKLDTETEMYLFAAARRDHVRNVIIPELQKKHVVITDRYLLSSLAYQGNYENYHDKNHVFKYNQPAISYHGHYILPDLTIFFDLNQKTEISRLERRKDKSDRIDKELENKKNLFKKLSNNYHQAINGKNNVTVIDAQAPRSQRANKVYTSIYSVIKNNIE